LRGAEIREKGGVIPSNPFQILAKTKRKNRRERSVLPGGFNLDTHRLKKTGRSD
jgi:hypothetical protein